jgi:hypothetical protein
VSITICKEPLLKLDRHHEAYEVSIEISADKYEHNKNDEEYYRFLNADCDSIVQDLISVD